MTVIPVELRDRAYDITVGTGLLDTVGDVVRSTTKARRVVVVTQEPIARHHLAPVESSLRDAGLDVTVVTVPDGEPAKDAHVLADLWQRFATVPLTRDDAVIALGGGVVGDLAGFAAASYNRGIAVIQVPTTLLAQVDASIGGKTGINLAEGKNLVGAFHQPAAVLIDIATLSTLGERERTEGFGEIVKYGVIRDPAVLDLLESDLGAARRGQADLLTELVERSARVKAQVVAADEREAGERAHLNLGHTYGHAVESLSGYGVVLHGEAVAIGMCQALRLGVLLGRTDPALVARIEHLLAGLGLPTRSPALDRATVWTTMARDKKATDVVRFVIADRPGVVTVLDADRAAVDASIDEVTDLPSPI